ncbi:tRNA (adenosine(37)-N6)-threonylcarbamoyltransferase complex dimerization subunit type 1 TsaB [Comamonas flocculans]|uniref:tRNA (Adenosine(37)-N6)-threonylcarbamoyltransferase complex dimerization subunit type 1 TsaB n=1 Tax=Comamonas flocculans TaxID=2597701 RepID=A0A5B8RXF6_9BURK|nr:tRNA (adenosine(37)-N6)-threonylcarbamoyltransferase complex dimerization subunit type 1 TsaB [Comamonas flocculans]QEA12925.1 tRNA (adenosine(37)-N6)-threonylcarbamoyltransferase complex dimerization subunit type 1 TsaB [Comamonas flocculans]
MQLLAFDTSTETLSVAVQAGERVWVHEGAGGAQASHTLIPAVRALLAQAGLELAQLDAIAFGQGPGSFTGLRTACAVAQGLAFGARGGAGLPLLPVPTLMAVAEEARMAHGCGRMLAMLDARMGEVYVGAYVWLAEAGCWHESEAAQLLAPRQVRVPEGWASAGNARPVHGQALAAGTPDVAALPTARALLALAPALLRQGRAVTAQQALPLYVRDKVAQTSAERAAAAQAARPA